MTHMRERGAWRVMVARERGAWPDLVAYLLILD